MFVLKTIATFYKGNMEQIYLVMSNFHSNLANKTVKMIYRTK